LDDEALLGPARRAIFEEGKNAARAWHDAAETVAADYRALDDEYMQARAEDLTGVARQGGAAPTGGGGATPSRAGSGGAEGPHPPPPGRRSTARSRSESPRPPAAPPRTAPSSRARSGSPPRSGSAMRCSK